MMDYYEILEISPKASQDVIGAVYKVLSQRHIPDKNANATETAHQLKAIRLAYGVLSDSEKRKAYDIELDKARGVGIELSQKPSFDGLAAESPSQTNRLKAGQTVGTVMRKRNISSHLSTVSRLSWKKWSWILSILAVVFLLFSMVQPDPEKAKRGQLAVKLEAERERGELEAEARKKATEEQKVDSFENERTGMGAANTKSTQKIAIDPAP